MVLPVEDVATDARLPIPCNGAVWHAGEWVPCELPAEWELIAACAHHEAAGPYCGDHKRRVEQGISRCIAYGHPIVLIVATPLFG